MELEAARGIFGAEAGALLSEEACQFDALDRDGDGQVTMAIAADAPCNSRSLEESSELG